MGGGERKKEKVIGVDKFKGGEPPRQPGVGNM